MRIQINEATSPSIIPGTIFEIGSAQLAPGVKVNIQTEIASYSFEIEEIEALGQGQYKASNSNNIVIFTVLPD